jgi:hypothetical protein
MKFLFISIFSLLITSVSSKAAEPIRSEEIYLQVYSQGVLNFQCNRIHDTRHFMPVTSLRIREEATFLNPMALGNHRVFIEHRELNTIFCDTFHEYFLWHLRNRFNNIPASIEIYQFRHAHTNTILEKAILKLHLTKLNFDGQQETRTIELESNLYY